MERESGRGWLLEWKRGSKSDPSYDQKVEEAGGEGQSPLKSMIFEHNGLGGNETSKPETDFGNTCGEPGVLGYHTLYQSTKLDFPIYTPA